MTGSATCARPPTRAATPRPRRYDVLDRPTTETDPLAHSQTAVYDAVGNLLQSLDPRGAVSSYSYDAANRMTSASYPEGLVTYAYDGAGHRIRMSDEGGTTTWAYDGAGRLLENKRVTKEYQPPGGGEPIPGITTVTRYEYDAAGNLRRQVDPDGGSVTYSYDAANRQTRATGTDGTVVDFGYDDAGRLVERTHPNGTRADLSYDDAGQVLLVDWTRSGGGTVSSTAYIYDDAGNRTRITDGRGLSQFSYDALDRLTGADYPDAPDVDYEYDAGGNRTRMTVGGAVTDYTYDSASRMLTAGGEAVEHDAAGNLTERGSREYLYDSQDRLVQVKDGTTRLQNSYDGDDRRLTMAVNAQVVSFAYDEHGALPNVVKEVGLVFPRCPIPTRSTPGAANYCGRAPTPMPGTSSTRMRWAPPLRSPNEAGATVAAPRYDAFGKPSSGIDSALGSMLVRGRAIRAGHRPHPPPRPHLRPRHRPLPPGRPRPRRPRATPRR